MPIVFTEVGGVARSGHLYDDRSGVSYEYPKRYKKIVLTGDRFVYHRPRVGYIGCGIIGHIADSDAVGRLTCEILTPASFEQVVPLKDPTGAFYEAPMWRNGNVYFAQGVRRISERIYESMLSVAAGGTALAAAEAPDYRQYANASDIREVDAYAVSAVAEWTRSRYPGESVEVMPHNNPGFDLRVGRPEDPIRYIEIKGTRSNSTRFFISEGERLFSIRESKRYTLVVVVGIELEAKTHARVWYHDGAVGDDAVRLEPRQWIGTVADETIPRANSSRVLARSDVATTSSFGL